MLTWLTPWRRSILVSIKPGPTFYCGLLHALFDDISIINGKKNTLLDKATVQKRLLNEGFCFASKTLPRLGQALDAALLTGVFLCPTNFRKHKNSALPAFMHGLLSKVFDASGQIKNCPDTAAIAECRQILFFFYKTVTIFSKRQQRDFSEKFKSTDELCYEFTDNISEISHQVLQLGREWISTLFKDLDPYDIVPSHGPGIVASGEKPHEKRIFSTKYTDVHEEYPYYRYFYTATLTHLRDTEKQYFKRTVKKSGENKVLFVPKDSRGPRVIAAEPLEYQFLQQGLRKVLYNHIESHPLTKGRVNFVDQSINQRLAEVGSLRDRSWITIDLKDASDRVGVDLVRSLFCNSKLLRPLLALRTPVSKLPDGERVSLKKYAAMGSALCFPIEAIVFASLLHGISVLFDENMSPSYVYGDDIVCKDFLLPYIQFVFTELGLELNSRKTCSTGFFRESCGAEFFKGVDVSTIKLRNMDLLSPEGTVSLVATSNLLFDRGYYKAAEYIQTSVERNLPSWLNSIPYGKSDSGYLCWFSNRSSPPLSLSRARINKDFQYWERRVPVVTGITYCALPKGNVHKYAEYFRKLTQGWSDEFRSGCYAKRSFKLKPKYVQVER